MRWILLAACVLISCGEGEAERFSSQVPLLCRRPLATCGPQPCCGDAICTYHLSLGGSYCSPLCRADADCGDGCCLKWDDGKSTCAMQSDCQRYR